MKRLLASVCAFFFLCHTAFMVSADEITREITQTFESDRKDATYDFAEETEIEGYPFKLKDVQYKVIDTIEPTAEKKYSISKKENLSEKKYTFPETKVVKDSNGAEYTAKLVDTSFERVVKTDAVNQLVTGTYSTGYSSEEPTFPESRIVTVTDERTGVTKTTEIFFVKSYIVDDFKWREDDLVVTLTLKNYGVRIYYLGDITITHHQEAPVISDENKIKLTELLGKDSEKYLVSKLEWDGEPFEEDGVKCRKALVHFDCYTAKWEAYYEGYADFESVTYTAVGKYEYTVNPTDKPRYVIEATATYTLNETVSTTTTTTTTAESVTTTTTTTTTAEPVTTTTTAETESTTTVLTTAEKKKSPTVSKKVVTAVSVGGGTVLFSCVIVWGVLLGTGLVFYDDKGKRLGTHRVSSVIDVSSFFKKTDSPVLQVRMSKSAKKKLSRYVSYGFFREGKPCTYTVQTNTMFVYRD